VSEPEGGDVRAGVDPWLLAFADANHLTITSGRGGTHNVGSKHYKGEAIDVRSRGMTDAGVHALAKKARTAGILLRDERVHPPGQKVWAGPHLHLELIPSLDEDASPSSGSEDWEE
jgi:hypothetical protein